MAIKYVKDFEFPAGAGFTGSAGKQPVKGYMRGGVVRRPAPEGKHVGGPNPSAEYPASKAHQSMPPNVHAEGSMHDKLYTQGKKLGFAKGGYVAKPMDPMDSGVMPAHKGRTQQEIEAGGSKRMKPGFADGGKVTKERALVKKIGQEVKALAKKPVVRKAEGGSIPEGWSRMTDAEKRAWAEKQTRAGAPRSQPKAKEPKESSLGTGTAARARTALKGHHARTKTTIDAAMEEMYKSMDVAKKAYGGPVAMKKGGKTLPYRGQRAAKANSTKC
jgi:hypothetical protein